MNASLSSHILSSVTEYLSYSLQQLQSVAQGSLQRDTVVETLQPVQQVLLAPSRLPPQGLLGY